MNEWLLELMCSKIDTHQHIVKEPVALDCGHCICKSCLTITEMIKCNKCGEINQRDLRDAKELVAIKKIISMHLPSIFNEIEKQTTESVAILKSLLDDHSESNTAKAIKCIENEIEIRIESMKKELDEIHEKFKTSLAALRNELEEKRLPTTKNHDLKLTDYEHSLSELRNDLQSKSEEALYHHQDVLLKLKESITKFQESFEGIQIVFEPSTNPLDADIVGEIYLKQMRLSVKRMKKVIEFGNYETISLDVNPYDSCVLPNNNTYASSNDNGTITIYDVNFKLLKTIEQMNNRKLNPFGITLDERNCTIYVSDHVYHCVYMMDMQFNHIKSFGSQGNKNTSLSYPYGVCFKNDCLYVADSSNLRIQILNANLEYMDTIKLNYQPYLVKVSNTTIGVCSSTDTYFYDLNSKALKYQYPGIMGRINEMHSIFYLFSYSPRKVLYVYGTDGILFQEINIDRFENCIQSYWDGHVTLLKNHLIVASQKIGKILKFPLKNNFH